MPIYSFIPQYMNLTSFNGGKYNSLILSKITMLNTLPTIPTFNDPKEEGFGKHYGKGENAGNQHFLLFPSCFILYQNEKFSFEQLFFCRLQMLSVWSNPNSCRFLKG